MNFAATVLVELFGIEQFVVVDDGYAADFGDDLLHAGNDGIVTVMRLAHTDLTIRQKFVHVKYLAGARLWDALKVFWVDLMVDCQPFHFDHYDLTDPDSIIMLSQDSQLGR